MRSLAAEGPPWWVWPVVLLCAVGLALMGLRLGITLSRGPQTAFVAQERARIAAYAQHFAPSRPPVIVVGNSTGKTALWDWTEVGDERLRMLRIVDHRASFDNFHALLQPILDTRPRVVVLQVQLMFIQPTWQNQLWQLRSGLTSRIGAIDSPEHVAFGSVCPTDISSLALDPPRLRAFVDEHTGWHAIHSRRTIDGPVPRRARAFVDRLVEAGIEVVLLALPRSPALEAAEPFFPPELAELTKALAERPGIHRIVVEPLAPELYCDDNHYTPEGRDLVVASVEPRLAAVLDATGP